MPYPPVDPEKGDAYVSPEDMQWIVALIESKAQHPDDIASVYRVRGNFDLEVIFSVTPRSRSIFSTEVCLEITRQVAERTGVWKPVIYVDGEPHSSAQESLDYRFHQV